MQVGKVFLDETVGEAVEMGRCDVGLTIFLQCDILAKDIPVAADDGLSLRIPDNQLGVRLFHRVVLIQVH